MNANTTDNLHYSTATTPKTPATAAPPKAIAAVGSGAAFVLIFNTLVSTDSSILNSLDTSFFTSFGRPVNQFGGFVVVKSLIPLDSIDFHTLSGTAVCMTL